MMLELIVVGALVIGLAVFFATRPSGASNTGDLIKDAEVEIGTGLALPMNACVEITGLKRPTTQGEVTTLGRRCAECLSGKLEACNSSNTLNNLSQDVTKKLSGLKTRYQEVMEAYKAAKWLHPSRMTVTATQGNSFYGPSLAPQENAAVQAMQNVPNASALDAALTRSAISGRGARGHASNRRLFGYTRDIDPLAVNDIEMSRAFPRAASAAPRNGSEAIVQKNYNFQAFRNAHNIDTRASFLRPVFGRQGWNKLGERTEPERWQQSMDMIKGRFANSGEFQTFDRVNMTPKSDHIYDMMFSAAHQYGIQPQSAYDGMSAEQSAAVVARHLRQ